MPDADERWLQRHQHVPGGRVLRHGGGLQPGAERAAGDEGHRHQVFAFHQLPLSGCGSAMWLMG